MTSPPVFKYTCSCCGQLHEGAPSFGFASPAPFEEQPQETKDRGHLDSDLCRYSDADGEHYFIRACLEVPIIGFDDPFLWGVWSSLSESSYERYVKTYDDPDVNDRYFGWLCNYLPFYPSTYAMKLDVHPRRDGIRPYVVPQDSEHPLSVDFRQGLSFERAREIAEHVLHAA